jgi:hypothetical protein
MPTHESNKCPLMFKCLQWSNAIWYFLHDYSYCIILTTIVKSSLPLLSTKCVNKFFFGVSNNLPN